MTQRIKIHTTKFYDGGMDYPVGNNIPQIKGFITKAIEAVQSVEHEIRPEGFGTINLFCRGSSGAILASMFAAMCPWDCKVLHVKKDGERSHGGTLYWFDTKNVNFMIDDFICSGDTIYEIYKAITNYTGNPFYEIQGVIVASGWTNTKDALKCFLPQYVFQTSNA